MIKKVTVTNYLNEAITMELGFPELSGFLVRSIAGLGPPKADINSTSLVTTDGSLFNSARIQPRNIVLKLDFLDNPTIEDIRLLSYKYFPIKKFVKLKIETDSRIGEVTGYIEANEPDIFSKKEGTQISMLCPDPYFYSAQEYVVSSSSNLANASYIGDANVGIVITLKATGAVTNPTITNQNTLESIMIDSAKLVSLMGSGIVSGDKIIISTLKNNKYIKLLRGGVYTNILNTLDRDTDWFELVKGNNIFVASATSGLASLSFEIKYRMVYEGV